MKLFFNQLTLPWLLKAFCLAVTSASGSTLCPIGIVQHPFKWQGHSFQFNFIVCQNLTRPVILGLDFMHIYENWLSWSDTGKGLLTLENKVLVETVNICKSGPQLITYSSLTLPPRTLSVINVHEDLKGNSTEDAYQVKPNSFHMDQSPYMVIIPVIHITPVQTNTISPFIKICPLNQSFFINMKF